MTTAEQIKPAEQRIAELETVLIRIAALASTYNAESRDQRFVTIGEIARLAVGEAQY